MAVGTGPLAHAGFTSPTALGHLSEPRSLIGPGTYDRLALTTALQLRLALAGYAAVGSGFLRTAVVRPVVLTDCPWSPVGTPFTDWSRHV